MRLRSALLLAAAFLLSVAVPASAGAQNGANTESGTVSVPISFEVVNENNAFVGSRFPRCRGDGETYTVRGHITAPQGALDDVGSGLRAATLYAHGHGYGEFFWRFQQDPDFNYALQQAQNGLTSVTYDKLGYGESGRPPGDQVCFGTAATVMDQIIHQLKAGDYELDAGEVDGPVRFDRVALAGHAQGAFTAELSAASFDTADALILASFGDATVTQDLLLPFFRNIGECFPNRDSYQERKASDEAFADNFHDAEPDVVEAAVAMRSADPCGYPVFSSGSALLSNQFSAATQRIDEPVLLLYGRQDPNFFVPAYQFVRPQYFTGSDDVQLELLDDTGQGITLERTAPRTRSIIDDWLTERDFDS